VLPRILSSCSTESVLPRILSSCSTEVSYCSTEFDSSWESSADTQLNCARLKSLQEFRGYNNFEKAVLAVAALNTETRETEDLSQCFMCLNTAGNGSLSKDEISAGIDNAGFSIPEAELTKLFEALDVDGSGKIHYTEWLAATVTPTLLEAEKTIQQVYDFFDFKQNGVISHEELLHVLGDINMVSAVMEAGDLDNNGELCKEEFIAVMQGIARKHKLCGGEGWASCSLLSDKLTGS